jgi:hypothetical protein
MNKYKILICLRKITEIVRSDTKIKDIYGLTDVKVK